MTVAVAVAVALLTVTAVAASKTVDPPSTNRQPKSPTPTKKGHVAMTWPFESFGGADGTRTRDPRRDRPVF